MRLPYKHFSMLFALFAIAEWMFMLTNFDPNGPMTCFDFLCASFFYKQYICSNQRCARRHTKKFQRTYFFYIWWLRNKWEIIIRIIQKNDVISRWLHPLILWSSNTGCVTSIIFLYWLRTYMLVITVIFPDWNPVHVPQASQEAIIVTIAAR